MPERQVKQSQTCCSGENILNSSEYQNKMTDRGEKCQLWTLSKLSVISRISKKNKKVNYI